MTTETIEETTISAVERAELTLRDAIASGDERRIDRAATRLEKARDAELKERQRAKDILAAEVAANQLRLDAARAEKLAKADAAESQLRKNTPTVVFYAAGKQLVVTMNVKGVQDGWSAEAVRRIGWKIAHVFAGRVVATRSLGEVAPEPDWLPAFLNDQSGGLHDHLKRGVVRVEDV